MPDARLPECRARPSRQDGHGENQETLSDGVRRAILNAKGIYLSSWLLKAPG